MTLGFNFSLAFSTVPHMFVLLALPFLSNTEVFLFPIAAVLLIYALNFIGYPFGFGWNASRLMSLIYFD